MIILSAALIYYVKLSRSKVHHHQQTSSSSSQSPSSSRRDNRFAISAVTLNLMFLFLNLPIVIDDLIGSSPSVAFDILDFIALLFYYVYFAIGFYTQLVVNSEFKNEFLKLIKLRPIGGSQEDVTKTNGNELNHSVTYIH